MDGKAQKRYRAAKILTAIPLIVFVVAMLCFIAAGFLERPTNRGSVYFFAHVHIFGLHVPPSDSLSDHLLYRNDICSFGKERACSCSHWNIYSGADRNYFFAVLHRSGSYCDLLYRTRCLRSIIDGLTFDEDRGQVLFYK